MIGDGRIVDAKTIMLLQYAALNFFRWTRIGTACNLGSLGCAERFAD
jgi:hypothetical protein